MSERWTPSRGAGILTAQRTDLCPNPASAGPRAKLYGVNAYSGSPLIYTYRWADAKSLPPFYVPVRISIGCPRYWPEASELDKIHELMPYDILGRVHSPSLFEKRYRARLDDFGPERIQRRFAALFERHSERPLVLLCYEDLHKHGEWCHRSMARRWWQDRTGVEIQELQRIDLAAPASIEPEPEAQQPLFAV